MKRLKVALIQNDAGLDPEANLSAAERVVGGSAGVDLVALPEVFLLRGGNADYREYAMPVPGPVTNRLGELARSSGGWLLAGSVIEADGGGVFNTSVLFDRTGRIAGKYRKMHLFEAHLDDGTVIREDETYEAGSDPVLVEMEGWRCGMSICYDVRFPELYRAYAAQGAHLLFIPANFTMRTGRDHWETLVRARAIENQCFTIAPNQCGANKRTGIESYGHSMVVGPWGDVLWEGGTEPEAATVELDPVGLDGIRSRIPVLNHRVM